MGHVTESEIFSRMVSELRSAVGHCRELATSPVKGQAYLALRNELKLVEGCCKQASAYREDTRWLNFAFPIAEAHKRAGNWLRGAKTPEGIPIRLSQQDMHRNFMHLAANLEAIMKLAEMTRHQRTGRIGMIVPDAMPGPHRDTRPVSMSQPLKKSPGGIILPSSL